MDNPDTDNTGYTIHITKGAKTEGAIKYEQSRHQQQWVHNTQNKGLRNPKGRSRMNNPDTNNTGYIIDITKVRENRRDNQV